MGRVSYIADKLSNLVSNLGTSRDKASHTTYGAAFFTDEELINAYRYGWLPRKIVDIPALDACRNWRNWQAEADQITAIESLETDLGLQAKVISALTKARLFGGAAIYIGTGDTNIAQPMRESAQIRHLTVLTRRQLTAGDMDIDPESPRYGLPGSYQLAGSKLQQDVHPSRLVIFTGNPFPDEELITGPEYGWGDSVLNATMEAIKQADGTAANIASLVFEAKVDVVKIPELMQRLSSDPQFETQVINRLTLAAQQKGINGMLMLDKEEEYNQKSANFSSLRDILMAFMQIVSGAADIPMTRLLGQSPGGLQASGDSDIRNYYDRIKAMQTLDIGPAMRGLDDLIIRNALGSRPPEVWYHWDGLWQPDAKEEADIAEKTASTIEKLAKILRS